MPESLIDAGLTIVLTGETHSTARVAILLENVQMLVSAAVLAALTNSDNDNGALKDARDLLLTSLEQEKAKKRFYPGFWEVLQRPGALPFELVSLEEEDRKSGPTQRDPFEPSSTLDVATLVGVNSWMQREILRKNPELHRYLFSFASIRRAEHNSPLLLELGVVLAGAVSVPVLLIYGIMRAVARVKRLNTEADIREVELEEKKVALTQRKVQLLIQEEIAEAFKAQRQRNPNYQVPDLVLANAVQFSAPAVADLGSSPLVEKISFNATIGGKG